MKIRNGFVSNSSSSSFLVALPKNESSPFAGELIPLLFGKETEFPHPYHDGSSYPVEAVVAVVARDLPECKLYPKYPYSHKAGNRKEMLTRLYNHLLYCRKYDYVTRQDASDEFVWLFDELDKLPPFVEHEYSYDKNETEAERQAGFQKKWDDDQKWEDSCMPTIEKLVKRMFKEMGKKYDFYMLRYADEDGSFFSAMEHGNLFRKVPHLRFSEH